MFKKLGDQAWRNRLFVKFDDLPKPLPGPFQNEYLQKVRVVIDTTSIKVLFKVQFMLQVVNFQKGSFLQPKLIGFYQN